VVEEKEVMSKAKQIWPEGLSLRRRLPFETRSNMRLLTVQETAALLGISLAIVYGLCARKLIRHERHGMGRGTIRIPEDALGEYRPLLSFVNSQGMYRFNRAGGESRRNSRNHWRERKPCGARGRSEKRWISADLQKNTDRSPEPKVTGSTPVRDSWYGSLMDHT
jgi:excisionase family DNA binding protein